MSRSGGEADSNEANFAGEIDDVRIYSLPLTEAELPWPCMAPRIDPRLNGLQAAVPGARHRVPEERNDACPASPDPGDEKLPRVAATLGVFAAVACAGLFPSRGPLPCVIVSLGAGLLFVPATASRYPC